MTEKENFLAILRGEKGEWVPNYDNVIQLFSPSAMQDPYADLFGQYFAMLEKGEDVSKIRLKTVDGFGISWVMDQYGAITEPGNYLLSDISEWTEKFHIPDLTGYDWDQRLKEDYQFVEADKAVEMSITGPFMMLINAMGVEGALISIAEDEETVRAFLDAAIGFEVEVLYNTVSRVHIDAINLFDDFAGATSMFVSPETFRRLLYPYEKLLIDTARKGDPDILIDLHVCGKCDDVIPDFMQLGINAWQPAQQVNDLDGLREKYPSLTLIGVWDNIKVCSAAEMSEEQVRQSVRDCIDRYGKNGGYAFFGGGLMPNSQEMDNRLAWAADEVEKYGKAL